MSVAEIFETMEYGPAPEGTGTALDWIKSHKGAFGLFIDGQWTKAKSGEAFDTTSPARGETLARIAQGDAADVDTAVAAARAAQPG